MANASLFYLQNMRDIPGYADPPESSISDQIGASFYAQYLQTPGAFGAAQALGVEDDAYARRNDELKSRGVYNALAAEANKAVGQPSLTMQNARVAALSGQIPQDNVRYQQEFNRLTDEYVESQRAIDPSVRLQTGAEIEAQLADKAQVAELEAQIASEREPNLAIRLATTFAGRGAAVMTDPINAASMFIPVAGQIKGASAGANILRGAAIDGVVNAGIEAFQTPERIEWLNRLGFEYGLGDAARDVALAGGAGFVFSGAIRGIGAGIDRMRRSADVIDAIARDASLPTEVRAAATYEAGMAHVKESIPVRSEVVSPIEMDNHQRNLAEIADALENGREPRLLEVRDIDRIATEIDPQAFASYQIAKSRYDVLTRNADEGYALRVQEIETEAAARFDARIAEIEAKAASANKRQAKIFQRQADDVRQEKSDFISLRSQAALAEVNELKLAAQSFDNEMRDQLERMAVARIKARESYKQKALDEIEGVRTKERILLESRVAQLQEAMIRNPQKADIFQRQIDDLINEADRLVPERQISKAEINQELSEMAGETLSAPSAMPRIVDDAPPERFSADDAVSEERLAVMSDEQIMMADFYRVLNENPNAVAGSAATELGGDVPITIRDVADEVEEIDSVIAAIRTCGVGR